MATDNTELYDLTIVGGGPAGLFAAFYSGMRDMKTKLIEARAELGGKVLVYPEKRIWDVPGITCIRGEVLIRQLVEQAMIFQPQVELGQQVCSLQRLEDGTLLVTTICGRRHHTRTLLLAVGRGVISFSKLEVAGAEQFEADNLLYTVTDSSRFRGKRVLISGGGDSAVDWAIELSAVARQVTLVHRRREFSGHESNVNKLTTLPVHVRTPYMIHGLHGSGQTLNAVTIAEVDGEGRPGDRKERIDVDAVIVSHGRGSDLAMFADWPLAIDDEFVQVDSGMLTNIPGVFAAGDIVDYDNKLRLIVGAFNEAAVAVNSAKRYLEPSAHRQAYVSSHNEKFMHVPGGGK